MTAEALERLIEHKIIISRQRQTKIGTNNFNFHHKILFVCQECAVHLL